jgi:hypothetical protein
LIKSPIKVQDDEISHFWTAYLDCIYSHTLSGIEGKMFKPMAMTFSFALVEQ